jgi:hypothetical protein
MSTITRKPSKPWRVEGNTSPVDCTSKADAYEVVSALAKAGVRTVVHQWISGCWVLYEIAEPGLTAKTSRYPDTKENDDATSGR